MNIAGSNMPLILALNVSGQPIGWMGYERCAHYYSTGKVVWTLGDSIVLRGGLSSITGERSTMEIKTIVAVRGVSKKYVHNPIPTLTNRTLFSRDKYMCAYCGNVFKTYHLTREHVVPTSRGGKNTWSNVVTACKRCNHKKGDALLQEIDMKLLYVPYVPSYSEHLILKNRRILSDQMEFLLKMVPQHSRLFNN